MKKVRAAQLNRINIHNPHNIATVTGEKVYLDYFRSERRSCMVSRWAVIGIKIRTDPTAGWYDRGCKTFTVSNKTDKEVQLQVAKDWVKKTYGIDLTDKDVWGGWHRAGTLNELRDLIKKEETE